MNFADADLEFLDPAIDRASAAASNLRARSPNTGHMSLWRFWIASIRSGSSCLDSKQDIPLRESPKLLNVSLFDTCRKGDSLISSRLLSGEWLRTSLIRWNDFRIRT
jgi:hypothetical protein